MANEKHHEFSPSKFERIESCRASYLICQGMSEERSKDSDRGTLLHEAVCDDNVLKDLPADEKQMILDIRKEYITPFQKEGFRHYNELYVEVKRGAEVVTAGWLDYLIISPDGKTARTIDFKFGANEVTPAKDNAQIMVYNTAVFQMFDTVDTIFSVIVQPFYGIGNYEGEAEFKRECLPANLDRIERAIERAKTADINNAEHYNRSVQNCRYCNRFKCPAMQKWMAENMSLLKVEELPKGELAMTIEHADRILLAKRAISDYMDQMTKSAEAFIIQSGGSPNYRVVTNSTRSKVDYNGLFEKFGITDADKAEFTKTTVCEPYLMKKVYRQPKPSKFLA